MRFDCKHCADGQVSYVRYGEAWKAEPDVGLPAGIEIAWVECECGRVTEGNELDADVCNRLQDEAIERGNDAD